MKLGPARAAFGAAHLIALGIFAQAVLAGLFLYVNRGLVAVHNTLGSVLVLLSVVLVVLAYLADFDPAHGLGRLAAVELVAVLAQYALGIAGRTSAASAALHVPVAFIAFTVAMLWMVRARRALRGFG